MTAEWAAKPTAVPYANYGNPQSLNLYSYVENNPTTTADLDGHQHCTGGGSGDAENHGLGTCDAVQKQKSKTEGVTSQAQEKKSQRGLTVGIGLSGNVDAGVVKAGAEANGSVVVTTSISSTGHPSAAVAGSGAAVAYAGNHVKATPKQLTKPFVLGLFGGGGINFMVANTASGKQLNGPFQEIAPSIVESGGSRHAARYAT